MNHKCQYGCGKNATYVLNSGKYCCSDDYRSCSAVIERMKQSLSGKHRKKSPINMRTCYKCKRIFGNTGAVGNHLKVCKGSRIYDEIRDAYENYERISVLRKKYGKKIVSYAVDGLSRSKSIMMKKAHEDGRSCSWSKRRSYAESLFETFLINIGFKKDEDFSTQHPFSIYKADFYFENKELVIEVDGQQHFRYKHQMDIDKRKNRHLNSLGIDVLRIEWKLLHNNAKFLFGIIEKCIIMHKEDRCEYLKDVDGFMLYVSK